MYHLLLIAKISSCDCALGAYRNLSEILLITSGGKDGTSSFSVIRVVSNTILPLSPKATSLSGRSLVDSAQTI